MLVDSLFFGLLAAVLRGGKFRHLLEVEMKYVWLIPLAFVIQFSAMFFLQQAILWVTPLSYGIILIFCFLNRAQHGFVFIVIGIALNLAAMLANGGRMPVLLEAAMHLSPEDVPALIAGTYGKHIALSAQTHLNFLGDIFYLKWPYPHPIVISVGDIILSLGAFIFIQKVMVKNNGTLREASDV